MSDVRGAWSATDPPLRTIQADLRLDNRAELVTALGLAADIDDSALVCAAYERYGDEIGLHLEGDFAIAIADVFGKELVLVRDAFGVKPLHYAQTRNGVVFATHLKDLLAVQGVDCTPCERAVVDYIAGLPRDEEGSFRRGIHRVPPAHAFRFASGRVRRFEWWRAGSVPEVCMSDGDAVDAFREAFERSVRMRLPANEPVAVLVSGGLDSASVACIAAKNGARVVALSAVFEGGDADERSFQRSVTERISGERFDVDIAHAPLEPIASVLDRLGEPTLAGGEWLVGPLLRVAKERGIHVVLTGVDGDRVVSHGEGRLEELALAGDFRTLGRELEGRGVTGVRAVRVMATRFARARVPALAHMVRTLSPRDRSRRRAELAVFHRDVLRRVGSVQRFLNEERSGRSAREMHLRALTRTDRTSDLELFPPLLAGTGMEARHPFFDRRLVELCISLPSDQKLRAGVSRFVLREAMRGVLPENVRVRRTKAYFDASFEAWATRHLELERVENGFEFDNLSAYLEPRRVSTLPVDALWRCVVVSTWLRGIGFPN